MKKLSLIVILLFNYLLNFGQQDSLLKVSLLTKFSGNITDFTTDNQGNVYLLTATDQIKKITKKGDSIAIYNDVRRFGKIYSIDATNPLKVLVYFKDFSTVVVLDRLLNVRNTINLASLNILQVKAITSSYDNSIWLFDELDSKIKKIDDNGKVVLESTDFRQVYDPVPTPTAIFDRDGQLYLYDRRKGLLVFDYYGAEKNNLKILDLVDVQVLDKNTIMGRDRSNLIVYKPATLQSFSYKLFNSIDRFNKINLSGKRLLGLTKEGELEIYSINNINSL